MLDIIYIPPGVYAQHTEGSCIHQSNENENKHRHSSHVLNTVANKYTRYRTTRNMQASHHRYQFAPPCVEWCCLDYE